MKFSKNLDIKKLEKETAVWNAAISLTSHCLKDKCILGRESMNTNNTAVGNCIVGMAVSNAAIFGKAAHSGAGCLLTWEAATSSRFPGPACRRGVVTGPVIFAVLILVQCFPVGNIWLDVP